MASTTSNRHFVRLNVIILILAVLLMMMMLIIRIMMMMLTMMTMMKMMMMTLIGEKVQVCEIGGGMIRVQIHKKCL